MIIIVAVVRVQPGKGAEYEAAMRELAPKFRAADPDGIPFYHCAKVRDEPDSYRVIETYRDQAAQQRHLDSALLQESFARMQPLIAEMSFTVGDSVT